MIKIERSPNMRCCIIFKTDKKSQEGIKFQNNISNFRHDLANIARNIF